MRKFLLTLLGILLIVGVLAGVGFLGYRLGYRQAALAASNSDLTVPPFGRDNDFNWGRMPMHGFQERMGPGLHLRMRPGGFGMMPGVGGFGIFRLLGLLIQLAILGFVVWLVYKLLTGWRLSLTPRSAPAGPRVEPAQPTVSETRTDETTG